jgi:integrase/recombinase XerD
VNCHTIRRSLATHLLAAGATPSDVAAILGHADLKSLSRYAVVVAGEVKATHEKTHPREVGGE